MDGDEKQAGRPIPQAQHAQWQPTTERREKQAWILNQERKGTRKGNTYFPTIKAKAPGNFELIE